MAAILCPLGELCSRFEHRRKLLAQTSGSLAILFAVPAFLMIGIPIAVIPIKVFATGVGVAVALWPLSLIVLLMLILPEKWSSPYRHAESGDRDSLAIIR